MITKVQKWGNSQGLRLSRDVLAAADIAVGDAVDVSVRDREIVIVPARRVRGGVDLAKLVSQIPEDYSPHELDWGPPSGREVW